MRRTTCGACGSADLEKFLDLGDSPIADAYTSTAEESLAATRYPLELAVCEQCQLVQLLEVVDHETLFGTGYSFYSSASAPLSAYHESYAEWALDGIVTASQPLSVVEVGCNDGDLLRHFDAAGHRTLGVDPASGPVAVARGRGLNVVEEPFGGDVARLIRDTSGAANLVIANHVLAHVESVADVLAGVEHLLAHDGLAVIEVQYLPDLLVNNAFDLVYHEHRNFFSLSSLDQALARHGLHVVDALLTDRQGGSLRVVAGRRWMANPRVESIRRSERWLQGRGAYAGFQGRVDRIRDRLVSLIGDKQVLGYGAPAKATTLLNFCGLDRKNITYVFDTTEAKQGRYIPGTGIGIVEPNAAYFHNGEDMVLLLAWNYAPHIIRNHLDYTAAGWHWLVPIPSPIVL